MALQAAHRFQSENANYTWVDWETYYERKVLLNYIRVHQPPHGLLLFLNSSFIFVPTPALGSEIKRPEQSCRQDFTGLMLQQAGLKQTIGTLVYSRREFAWFLKVATTEQACGLGRRHSLGWSAYPFGWCYEQWFSAGTSRRELLFKKKRDLVNIKFQSQSFP